MQERFHSRLMAHLLKLFGLAVAEQSRARVRTGQRRQQHEKPEGIAAAEARACHAIAVSCQRMDTRRAPGQMTWSGWRTRMQDAPENKKLTKRGLASAAREGETIAGHAVRYVCRSRRRVEEDASSAVLGRALPSQ